jgi:hypothetical protein
MEIIEASEKDFNYLFPDTYHSYNSVNFNLLNKNKCEQIKFLVFKDNKVRLGLIVGLNDNCLISPFSAPFGGFSFKDDQIQIQKIEEAVNELINYSINKKYKSIKVVFPPIIYNDGFISKCISCFSRLGFNTEYIDLNFHFDLNKLNENYIHNILWRNARKNLTISQKYNFIFSKTENNDEFKLAYDVIKQNREARGFPLRMSFEQVFETTSIIECDSFLLYLDNKPVASAIVFHVTKNIVQVIYWGDIPDYSDKKTMNLLSYKVFEYYKKTNIKVVDIGPSTDKGQPNYGLCEFKESIGCTITPKYSFIKELNYVNK